MSATITDELQKVLNRTPESPEVVTILSSGFLDYREPLDQVWKWNRSGESQNVDLAQELLASLAKDYPNGLKIWFELAFSFVKQNKPSLALRLLVEVITPRFGNRLDTDTFCLWGRLHKDAGDEYRKKMLYFSAEEEYSLAEAKYEDGYRVSNRDRFPGINVATLCLMQAVMRKKRIQEQSGTDTQKREEISAHEEFIAKKLRECEQRAAEVLASRMTWQPKLIDDAIWMAATEAEAYLLQKRLKEAAEFYSFALRKQHNPMSHHFQSIGAQLKRLCEAFGELVDKLEPPFDNPDTFIESLKTTAT